MPKRILNSLRSIVFISVIVLPLCGCGKLVTEAGPRFFWPPPPMEPKIEYINFYFTDEDLQRGVDRRLEKSILGLREVNRLIVQPYSVASDGKGRFLVVDFAGGIVHVYDRTNHEYRQLVVGVEGLQKIAVDSLGEIWVLNGLKSAILHFSADEENLGKIELSGTFRAASFAIDRSRDRIYVVDSAQHQLRVYDLAGRFLQTFGSRGMKPGEFNYPSDIDLDAAGNLYVVDALNARIQILAPDGTFQRTFGERGTSVGSFSIPKGIAVSPSGLVYVSDATQHKIVVFNATGDYLLSLGGYSVFTGAGISPGGFSFPAGLDADKDETLWVADLVNGLVHEFQYLTPEYLAKKPIRKEDVYHPQGADYQSSEDGALLPDGVK